MPHRVQRPHLVGAIDRPVAHKTASELRYMGQTLSDNRHGLVVSAMATNADGHAKREAAKVMHQRCQAGD